MKRLTAIAISGGVDSLMAGYFLKAQGDDVVGIHFVTGYESMPRGTSHTPAENPLRPALPSQPDDLISQKISSIADQIGIRFEILDLSTEFDKAVVSYFKQTYQAGRTPNPCMICNPAIKFGTVYAFAKKLGASRLATGHYARTLRDTSGRFHLLKGIDPLKDQSYFLARLNQQHLSGAVFPLGGMTKSEVKKRAAEKGLSPVTTGESQDVCFIKGRSYGEFLMQECGFKLNPGPIEDLKGNILGEHKGLHLFTIGQRRGINCPASDPYYVVRIDRAHNRLVVGFKKDLLSSECRVTQINWIGRRPKDPIDVHTRIRYRHKAAPSKLFPLDESTATVKFSDMQSAITPGQGAVFYHDDEVLGGGWIE